MLVKIHQGYRKTVALCDSDLIGKSFEQGIKQIELIPNFFKGDEKDEQEVIDILKNMIKEDATFNIVGEKSVQIALKLGIIKQEGIMRIDNVPVALILL
jgi:hypothetical protein